MGEKKRKRQAVMRASPTAKVIFNYINRRNDTELPPDACLDCGTMLTCATSTEEGVRVYPGAITACWSCGHLMAFDENLRFRPLTDEEIVGVAGQDELVAALTIRGQLREFWKRDDAKGAFEFVIGNIRKEVGRTRERR